MLLNLLENILVRTPDSWLTAGARGDNLLFAALDSLDRVCGQFATALRHAEQDHLFLLIALLGTLTLVFPARH